MVKDVLADSQDRLIAAFLKETDLHTLEELADNLALIDRESTRLALLSRLADSRVRDDDDTFDAVCSALVQLGVMIQRGNMNYVLDPQGLTSPALANAAAQLPMQFTRAH